MRGNIAQLMQQAQRMQDNLQRAQEDIAKLVPDSIRPLDDA